MDVLVTGGDTDLGRTIAEGFRDAGHKVVIAGARRDDLEVAAKELDVDTIVFDNTDPASLDEASSQFPHHLDTIINVPAPRWDGQGPAHLHAGRPGRGMARLRWTRPCSPRCSPCRSSVITCARAASIVNVVPENPREGGAEAGIKAAMADWTAGQATHFGVRGITVNAVASGLSTEPGYEGLSRTPPSVGRGDHPAGAVPDHAAGPPHHRPDAARQPGCTGQLRLIFPGSPRAKRGDGPA